MSTSVSWDQIGFRGWLAKIRRRFIAQTSAYLTTHTAPRAAPAADPRRISSDDSQSTISLIAAARPRIGAPGALRQPVKPDGQNKTQEIVGAIVDAGELTTDIAEIDAAVTSGLHVDYINRARAQFLAEHTGAATWKALAVAPTLIVLDYRGRPVGNPSP